MLRRRPAEKLRDQRAQSGGILRPGQRGGQLHVEQLRRPPADGQQAELHFAPPGVDDRLVARRGDGLPERRHVADGHGVDHGQLAVGGDLDQAQHRPVGVFRDELRVEGDGLRVGELSAILPQLFVGGDVVVLHGDAAANLQE